MRARRGESWSAEASRPTFRTLSISVKPFSNNKRQNCSRRTARPIVAFAGTFDFDQRFVQGFVAFVPGFLASPTRFNLLSTFVGEPRLRRIQVPSHHLVSNLARSITVCTADLYPTWVPERLSIEYDQTAWLCIADCVSRQLSVPPRRAEANNIRSKARCGSLITVDSQSSGSVSRIVACAAAWCLLVNDSQAFCWTQPSPPSAEPNRIAHCPLQLLYKPTTTRHTRSRIAGT